MVKSQAEIVYSPEVELIDVIHKLVFGELYGIEIPAGGETCHLSLTPAEQSLLYFIRDGCQYIDILTVHKGQPVQVEVPFSIGNFHGKRRVRFPTGQPEG